jgi:hypothetical protein
MFGVPRTVPAVSRRRVLAGGATLALLGAVTAACGAAPPPNVDDLKAQLELARHDSDLAAAAAPGALPPIAGALTTVASQRSEHAQALCTEIARVTGGPTSTSPEAPTSTTAAPQSAPPSVPDVVNALRSAADNAAQLAATTSGYRAGLLGSIAAACTAAYTVALAPDESGS